MAKPSDDREKNRHRDDTPAGGEFADRLARLDERLGAAKGRRPDQAEEQRRGNAMGVALRIATELVAGIVVGGFIGWQLDEWLGTTPILLLVFFMLGAAAGILNVMRTAYKMQPGQDPNGK